MAGPYWNDEAQRWESGDEGPPAPHTPPPPPLPPLPSSIPTPVDPLAPVYVAPSYYPAPAPVGAVGSGTRSLRGWFSPFAAGAAVVVLALGAVTVWFTVGSRGAEGERTGAKGASAVRSAGTSQRVAPATTVPDGTTAEDGTTPPGGTTTEESLSPDATGSPEVPAGYRLVADSEGFTIAVPEDWERSLENDRVFYRTADRASLVQIFQVTEQGMTPGEAVRLASTGLRDGTEGYEEIRVGPVDGAVDEGMSAELVYEYDSEESGGRRRGVERVFRVSSGDLWAVLVAAPAGEWPLQEKVLDTAAEYFQPNDTL
ncbi:serine/arginine repetitive matrix protein 2 [Streptomyces sp. NPDC055287]